MFLTENLEHSCKNYVINSKRARWGIFKNVRKFKIVNYIAIIVYILHFNTIDRQLQ